MILVTLCLLFNPWWHGCGPQNLRVQMATVGLGSLAWPIAGTMLAGLLLTHNCICSVFQVYSYLYQTNHKTILMIHIFPLPNMPVEVSHKHVLSCMSHAMHDHHMCRYLFLQQTCVFCMFSKRSMMWGKTHAMILWNLFRFFSYMPFKFVIFVLHNAFHGVFELAKRWEHVSKISNYNVNLGHLSNLLTPLSILMYKWSKYT